MTLAEKIEQLARVTGAPSRFIDSVRTMFVSKGIALESDASPYEAILSQTFQRDQEIRDASCQAMEGMLALRDSLGQLQSATREQLTRLHDLRDTLIGSLHRLEEAALDARLRRELKPPGAVPGPADLN